MPITQEEFNALMAQWIADNGGQYNSAHKGADIDAAVTAVKNKEEIWDNATSPIDDSKISVTTSWSSEKIDTTKQDDIKTKRVLYQRNSSANPQYALIATVDLTTLTSITNPLEITGTIGSLSGSMTKFEIILNLRNGASAAGLRGYVDFDVSAYADIILTKSDDGNTAYLYAYFPNAYGYMVANIAFSYSSKYAVAEKFVLTDSIQGTEVTRLSTSKTITILKELSEINDDATSATETWSSSKVDGLLGNKANYGGRLGSVDINDNSNFVVSNIPIMYDCRSTCTNLPIAAHGLLIRKYFDNATYAADLFIPLTHRTIFRRNCNPSGWGEWAELTIKSSENEGVTVQPTTAALNSSCCNRGTVQYCVKNGFCTVNIDALVFSTTSLVNVNILSGTLPKPLMNVQSVLDSAHDTGNNIAIEVDTNGQLMVSQTVGIISGYGYGGGITYPIA